MKKFFTPLRKNSVIILALILFSTFRIQAQCVANFSVTYNPGGNVSFSNTSTYPLGVTGFTWFTSAGGSGTQTNFSHTFASNGNYTVYLSLGTFTPPYCSSNYSAVVTITNSPCNQPLNVSFTGTTGPAASYSVTSTTTGTTPGATYVWFWGDNTTGSGPLANHVYTANGWYQVKLAVTDGLCTDTTWNYVSIVNVGCSLVAGFTYSAGPNGQISFSSTSTGTTMSTVYQWTLGDGGTGNGTNFTHTYQNNGIYYVDLYIYNPNGTLNPTCWNAITATVAVNNATCNITPSFTSATGPNGSFSVTSTSTGTTPGATYLWRWGDNFTGTGPNAVHTYTANGVYVAWLIINDVCIDSVAQFVNINNVSCGINSSFAYTANLSGQVSFSSTSTGTIAGATYTWSYGDGYSGTGSSPSHNYSGNGYYTVMLTAANPNGTNAPICSDTYTQIISVNCNLSAGFNYTVGNGGAVNFVSTSTGTVPAVTYTWTFGDGYSATGPFTSHTYSNGGIYNVMLLVDNGGFCYDTISQNVNVNTIPCTANSNFTATSSGQPLLWYAMPAYFGNVVNAIWYWGDGSSTNALFPSHTYSAAGFYNICLSVTVSCAQSSSTCSSYNIYRLESTAAQMATIQVVQALPTSLKELDQNNASSVLYPNPNNGSFSMKLKNALQSSSQNVEINIFDITGKLLVNETQIVNGDEMKIASDLPDGVYVLKVKFADGSTGVQRLVISRRY